MIIARLPAYDPSDEWCVYCHDDNVVLVINNPHGENIVLCSKCFYQMMKEIKDEIKI